MLGQGAHVRRTADGLEGHVVHPDPAGSQGCPRTREVVSDSENICGTAFQREVVDSIIFT